MINYNKIQFHLMNRRGILVSGKTCIRSNIVTKNSDFFKKIENILQVDLVILLPEESMLNCIPDTIYNIFWSFNLI